MRILLVEDDIQLSDVTRKGLQRAGFAVDQAFDGIEALEKASMTTYDVVILDRDLPEIHGDEVCQHLVDRSVRVLMLTALGHLDDRVRGLNLGADDYLTKPFALKELVARVRAVSRRSSSSLAPALRMGDLELSPSTFTATRSGRELGLTPKEFGVLETLMRAAPAVVSAEELLERVWDENADPFTNAIRVTMVTLRRKLGDPPLIETHKGVGYRVVSA